MNKFNLEVGNIINIEGVSYKEGGDFYGFGCIKGSEFRPSGKITTVGMHNVCVDEVYKGGIRVSYDYLQTPEYVKLHGRDDRFAHYKWKDIKRITKKV